MAITGAGYGDDIAMKRRSSLTAAGIATVRALESEKPPDQRVCYDPFARRFVGAGLYALFKFFYKLGYGEHRGPGVIEFLIARERYIDDFLRSCLQEGLEQLVILGAGYDARAYRFEELLRDVAVFEVDHPATQAVKLKKLAAIFGRVPAHVTYVPVDFDQQVLGQCLLERGYDETRVTLFIWQGVTPYLTPKAVDSTLAFVAQHSAPGSSIVFDYMDPALLEGASGHGEVRTMRRVRSVSGEGLTFGIPIAQIQSFLESRGFTQVRNADHITLERQYFGISTDSRPVADGYAIATAVVPHH
jgi:methyltransferase (TIGR00027 family)